MRYKKQFGILTEKGPGVVKKTYLRPWLMPHFLWLTGFYGQLGGPFIHIRPYLFTHKHPRVHAYVAFKCYAPGLRSGAALVLLCIGSATELALLMVALTFANSLGV